MRVFLIGFMGSGKSHIGKGLATSLKMEYCDLDANIEEKATLSISKIFEQFGQEHFRLLEQSALHDTLSLENAVISTGGGAPCFFDNISWMNRQGLTIYLDTPAELLAERLRSEMEHRPLLAHLTPDELVQFIEEKVESRRPFYEQAQIIWSQNRENQSDWNTLIEKIRARLSDPGKI